MKLQNSFSNLMRCIVCYALFLTISGKKIKQLNFQSKKISVFTDTWDKPSFKPNQTNFCFQCLKLDKFCSETDKHFLTISSKIPCMMSKVSVHIFRQIPHSFSYLIVKTCGQILQQQHLSKRNLFKPLMNQIGIDDRAN